jgi:protein-L-isoaspartate(D-aspartate) O-methyltransferase
VDPDLDVSALTARSRMVQAQLRARGIADERVLAAMTRVPRERFLPIALQHRAYDDGALPIGYGQTMSQPYMVARACELARLAGHERVLDVGAGSGYQAAVLGALARHVVSIERIEALAEHAKRALTEAGIDNVDVVVGDGSKGYARLAPYEAILVAAGAPVVPPDLVDQLAIGGRLVIPVGRREMQKLLVLTKTTDGLTREEHDACVYVPLVGASGWTRN